MTLENFKQKLENKFPEEKYVIIRAGESSSDRSILKCLDCGRRIEVSTGELFSQQRKHLCSKCYYKRQDALKNEKTILSRLENKAYDIKFFMKGKNSVRRNMVSFICKKCGRINTREVTSFLHQNYDCGYCAGKKESKDTDRFLMELNEKYGNKFALLTEYVSATSPIMVRCNECGFIRKVKPPALLTSGFCPKCEKRRSNGEKRISKFLTKNNIDFIPQMYFSNWGIGLHYFDFYVPSFNLVLEFHGKQHYQFDKFFHKNEEDFLHRREKDKIKKEEAIKNNFNYISISYKLIDNIDVILGYIFNSTTIPQGSRGKCLEIETIQNLDEDIVCSLSKDKVET